MNAVELSTTAAPSTALADALAGCMFDADDAYPAPADSIMLGAIVRTPNGPRPLIGGDLYRSLDVYAYNIGDVVDCTVQGASATIIGLFDGAR